MKTKPALAAAAAGVAIVTALPTPHAGALGVVDSKAPYIVNGKVYGTGTVDPNNANGILVSSPFHHIQRSYWGWGEMSGTWTWMNVGVNSVQKTNEAKGGCGKGHLYRWHSKWTVTNNNTWSVQVGPLALGGSRNGSAEWYNPAGSGKVVC